MPAGIGSSRGVECGEPVRAGRDDGREGEAGEAGLADLAFDGPGHLGLRAAHQPVGGDALVDVLELVHGVADGRELELRLATP